MSELETRDLLHEVEHYVTALPDKQRVALTCGSISEMSYPEIASNLKCSEAAARANVHEALRKLREGALQSDLDV